MLGKYSVRGLQGAFLLRNLTQDKSLVTIERLDNVAEVDMISLNDHTIVINDLKKLAVVRFDNDLKPAITFIEPENDYGAITAFSKISADRVACSYSNGNVLIWDIPAEKCQSIWTPQTFPSETGLALRKIGQLDFLITTEAGVLVYGKKKSLHFYNLSENTPISSIDLSNYYNEFEYTEGLCVNNEQIVALTRRDGAYKRNDCRIYIWDNQGEYKATHRANELFGLNLLLSSTESTPALEMIRLINLKASWDFKTRTSNCKAEAPNGMNKLYSAVNGDTLAICKANNSLQNEPDEVELWNINNGKCIARFSHKNIRNMVVMPNQSIMILGGEQGNELSTHYVQSLSEAQEASAEQSSYMP